MKRFEAWLFKIFDEDDEADFIWNKRVSSFIMLLIILSIVAVVVESDAIIAGNHPDFFYNFELVAVIIFTIEYISRILTAHLHYTGMSRGRAIFKYMTSTMAIIDFLAILPFYIELGSGIFGVEHMIDMRFIRVLRLMRLLRIFKLNRYSSSMKMIADVMKEEKEKLFITVFMTAILLILSSALVYTVEHEAQPENFPNIYSSMWWAIATLTTVGYGDVYPVTALGKILAGVIALLGIGLVALPTGILSGSFVQAINAEKESELAREVDELGQLFEREITCPHCGKQHVIDIKEEKKGS
jgi:voltage-gated potassium channel